MSTTPQFFSVPTPYPVKSSVLRWRPVLSRLYPRVQRSNKRYEKIEGCEQSICIITSFLLTRQIIRNGDRTEWSPIRAVIIRVITKLYDRATGVRFVYHEYDYGPNWTTRSLIII